MQGYPLQFLAGEVNVEPRVLRRQRQQMPKAQRHACRSLDRQYLTIDGRLVSRLRPPLWNSRSASQILLTGPLTRPPNLAPPSQPQPWCPTCTTSRGAGGRMRSPYIEPPIPLSRTFPPRLLDLLNTRFARDVTPLAFAAYMYGILAHPADTRQFSAHLYEREIRVPITKGHSSQN